ncbi:MAG: phosphoribosylformylglycinamidine cyclo-ligase, partial [Clostridiales bacterium]|nr:phosphoribosylformylglycinamidine cyclo-ligase [Clostridiales bacterium]
AEGCVQAGCALVGGETAEMPGFYPEDEYDLAGFSVGVVDKSKILDKDTMQEGDVLIALPSSGVHSNGFSLVRKVFQVEKGGLDRRYDDLSQTLGETLLTPTRIYVKPVLALLKAGVRIRSISHITGGGFYENIPRSLAEGMTARIERSAVRVLPIFDIIAREGGIPERDMFNTFNMGVGMCLTVAAEDVDLALDSLADAGEEGAYALGEIARGEGGIELC